MDQAKVEQYRTMLALADGLGYTRVVADSAYENAGLTFVETGRACARFKNGTSLDGYSDEYVLEIVRNIQALLGSGDHPKAIEFFSLFGVEA